MEKLEFTEEFKTDIQSIDYEHRKLVQYINAIIEGIEMGDAGRLVVEVNMDELINYTVYHFKHEEELMEKHQDPNYEKHKKQHEDLKAKVLDFKERFNKEEDISEELVKFLRNWLFGHIKGTDMSYVDLFQQHNVDDINKIKE